MIKIIVMKKSTVKNYCKIIFEGSMNKLSKLVEARVTLKNVDKICEKFFEKELEENQKIEIGCRYNNDIDIDNDEPREVKFIHASDFQVNWGSCDDPRGVLVPGKKYVLEHLDVHSYHTKVFLEGVTCKRGFPSSCFMEV